MKTRLALACALFVGCTFGGGSDDPTDGIATADIDGGEPSTDTGSTGMRDAAMGGMDATVSSDAGKSTDAGKADAGQCGPATPLTACDPVKNSGCALPVQQCDLNTAGAAQAGRCVFFLPALLGGCSTDGITTSCGPGNACINNACVEICYCDSDCTAPKKCSGTAPGAAGPVKTCQ